MSASRWLRAGAVVLVAMGATVGDGLSAPNRVEVVSDDEGQVLRVDGEDLMVLGMNWGYMPIGQNYTYSLWEQPEDVIEAALDREMPLLRDMGVNVLRQYTGIPPRWIEYIYDEYGIYTVLNHTVARYGYTIDGAWIPNVDYSDPRLRSLVTEEVMGIVNEFKDTRGVLMWLLGNENNYGLSWSSFEIEALPEGERQGARARYLYSLFGDITRRIQAVDKNHPVAICNGDVQYIDLIAEECGHIDVFGTNVYRGISVRDMYDVVKEKLGVPVLFTEFGSDAWNAKEMREDQIMQCRYLVGQWQEIYEQSRGKGRVGNSIGGLIFQWSDGWWKFGQETRLDIHDTNASWPNGGYVEDYVEGENNMNEEWWGITAKGWPDDRTLYDVYPRAAYYALQRAFTLDPYASTTTIDVIRSHFGSIAPASAALAARGDRASLLADSAGKVKVSGLEMKFETVSTGGERVTTPETAVPGSGYPTFRGFDQLQAYMVKLQAEPNAQVVANLSVSILGDVPDNTINEIFYENRGRTRSVNTPSGELALEGIERVDIYQADISWIDRWFQLDGFYRTGHYHWGYEGDFFGLYRDAYYGENVDIYNGRAPFGVEFRGRRGLSGVTLALGTELWWGANPSFMGRINRRVAGIDATLVFQQDLANSTQINSTNAIPLPETRKISLQGKVSRGSFTLEAGGLWAGEPRVGESFNIAEERDEGQYAVFGDEIKHADTFGGKAKLTYQKGRWNAYAQAAYMGLVADGGPTAALTFTGWTLKDTGSGNQSNVIGGVALNVGNFQVSPNVLYQRPIVDPIPLLGVDDIVGGGPIPAPRNVLDDPFAVRANREKFGAELLITYDPTPATWMWQWDGIQREDARFAANVGFVYQHQPTTQDASIGILDDGVTSFAFPGAPPAQDLYEVRGRVMSKLGARSRLVAHGFVGTAEATGSDPRRIERWGGDARLALGSAVVAAGAKFNDWGPYDYHRDFNLTYPVQLDGDLSYILGTAKWFGEPQTKIGLRGIWRSLDRFSPRYCPVRVQDAEGTLQCDPLGPGEHGNEWEIRTYVHVSM